MGLEVLLRQLREELLQTVMAEAGRRRSENYVAEGQLQFRLAVVI